MVRELCALAPLREPLRFSRKDAKLAKKLKSKRPSIDARVKRVPHPGVIRRPHRFVGTDRNWIARMAKPEHGCSS